MAEPAQPDEFPLTRRPIWGEISSISGLRQILTQPASGEDALEGAETIDPLIPHPTNLRVIAERLNVQPDGSKTADVTLEWSDAGGGYEYEIQIGIVLTT